MAPDYVPAEIPLVGRIFSSILHMVTLAVLCICITRRTHHITKWSRLPLAQWLLLIIFVDSALFVFATGILTNAFGTNSSREVCESAVLICLVFYMSTKMLIYYFLVERAYVISGSTKPRMHSKLWIFNCLFMLLPYSACAIINFVFRIAYINDDGVCIIGMKLVSMLPLILFEVIVNIYLTLLFVLPLRKLHSFKSRTNPALNRMAFRSFIGSCATLTTSVVNLTIVMVLQGEPSYICLLCCNADILLCVMALHWVSSKENRDEDYAGYPSGPAAAQQFGGGATHRARMMELGFDEAELKDAGSHGIIATTTVRAIAERDLALRSLEPALRLPASITTECKRDSSPPRAQIRVLHHKGPSWDVERSQGFMEDEVELHNIRVRTSQPRASAVEGVGKISATVEEADEWLGSERKVVGERMV